MSVLTLSFISEVWRLEPGVVGEGQRHQEGRESNGRSQNLDMANSYLRPRKKGLILKSFRLCRNILNQVCRALLTKSYLMSGIMLLVLKYFWLFKSRLNKFVLRYCELNLNVAMTDLRS